MFIVFLRFAAQKARAGEFMEDHKRWIQQGLSDGAFVLVGTLQPQAGGAILAELLLRSRIVCFPGGFAHGDHLRTGAIARFSPIMGAVEAFAAAGGPVLGSCNGCQILSEAGLLPGVLMRNDHLQFRCDWQWLRVEATVGPWLSDVELGAGDVIRMPISHGEGWRQKATHACPSDWEVRREPVMRCSSAASRSRAFASISGLGLLIGLPSRSGSRRRSRPGRSRPGGPGGR